MENFTEKILDMLNQNVEDALEKFQNKEYEKTQKQMNTEEP
jgi:hypothetical protein